MDNYNTEINYEFKVIDNMGIEWNTYLYNGEKASELFNELEYKVNKNELKIVRMFIYSINPETGAMILDDVKEYSRN